MKRSFLNATWAVVALASLAMAGCAADVVDIDRTQANKIKKGLFTGEWYFRPTVVENSFNQGIIFEGLEGEMDRIRWEIREHELIAYRSWKLLDGAEQGNGALDYEGGPVAAFAISSHFDVLREFNAATGEQNNVLYEDTTLQPWYERDYIRVDWSTNLIGAQDFVFGDGSPYYSLEGFLQAWSGAPYYAQEHEYDNPYRAEVTPEAINIVNNYHLVTDFETCYYALLDPYFCGTSTGRMKLSFRKVADSDYEPLYYPDNLLVRDANEEIVRDSSGDPMYLPMFERFGFFRTRRLAYDNEYQWTRNGRVYLANRWNIWGQTHNAQGVKIPMLYREAGKVVYFTNVDFPDDAGDQDIWNASVKLVDDWDSAFRETVALVKQAGGATITTADVDSVFELRRNNCNVEGVRALVAANKTYELTLREYGMASVERGNLKRACTVLEATSNGAFTWQKQGDLRYSFINWVDTPQQAGPLGYGPSAADPITGEIISANANLYGAAVDTYAAYAADVVAVMNGDIDIQDVATGEQVRDHVEGRHRRRFGDYSSAKLAEQRSRMQRDHSDMTWQGRPNKASDAKAHRANMKLDPEKLATVEAQLQELARHTTRAKLDRVAGSSIERELLMSDDLKRAFLGPDGYQAGSTDVPVDFSVLKSMLDEDIGRKHHEAVMELAKHSIMLAEWADPGMLSLVHDLEGKSWDEVYAFMRREVYRGVMAHEVGHTLGLRHNFEGSMDPLNYQPEFWDYYNTTTGKVDKVRDGVPTRAERLMYSSIMDYDARFYADSLEGIGPYDKAAIRFGYGGLVEVFDRGVANLWYDNFLFFRDYTDIPRMVSGEWGCSTQANCPDEIVRIYCNSTEQDGLACPADQPTYYGDPGVGLYDQYLQAKEDGNVGKENELYEYVNRYQVSYLKDGLEDTTPRPENIWKRTYVPFEDIKDYVAENRYNGFSEVPYAFCPDEWAYPSNISCQPYDKGANFLEVMTDRMERYDAYYFFSNFKRDRVVFNDNAFVGAYMSRLLGRFFGPMSNVYRYYLYGFSGMGYDKNGEYLTLNDFPVGEIWQSAAMEGLNHLTSVVQQPEPGDYCLNTASNEYQAWKETDGNYASDCAGKLEVPLGVGKNYFTNWTDEYYYKATRIGTFFDKYIALWSMTDNRGFFYQNYNDMLDSGAFALSYWRGMQNEMLDIFNNVFTGRSSKFAWRYDAAAQDGAFVPLPVVDLYEQSVDENLPKIQSASSWTLRYFGIVLPMARFNSYYDYTQDFSNYARVCLDGYVDCLQLSKVVSGSGGDQTVDAVEDVDYTAFTDPMTGYRYIASLVADDNGALGAIVLDEAKRFVTDEYEPSRVAYDASAAANTAAVAAAPPPAVVNPLFEDMAAKESALRVVEAGVNERSAFLDIMREITYLMEFGD